MSEYIKVEFQDDKDKVVATYFVHKLTVEHAARRFRLTQPVMEDKTLGDHEKNQMLNCVALACSVRDEKGNLLFDGDDGAKRAYAELDYEISLALVETYLELNPIKTGLKAKKKKY